MLKRIVTTSTMMKQGRKTTKIQWSSQLGAATAAPEFLVDDGDRARHADQISQRALNNKWWAQATGPPIGPATLPRLPQQVEIVAVILRSNGSKYFRPWTRLVARVLMLAARRARHRRRRSRHSLTGTSLVSPRRSSVASRLNSTHCTPRGGGRNASSRPPPCPRPALPGTAPPRVVVRISSARSSALPRRGVPAARVRPAPSLVLEFC